MPRRVTKTDAARGMRQPFMLGALVTLVAADVQVARVADAAPDGWKPSAIV